MLRATFVTIFLGHPVMGLLYNPPTCSIEGLKIGAGLGSGLNGFLVSTNESALLVKIGQ